MENAVRLRRAQAELTVNSAADRRHEAAVAAALKLKPRMRFAGLGAIFARLGPFDAWIVAAGGPNGLRAVAVSAAPAPIAPLEDGCALADSLRRNSIIVRTPASARAAVYPEDRIFAGFAAYACVPLDSAAVALAARQPIETATIASLEALATRVGPIVAGWLAQAEVEQLRRLVRNLGLRMFGAIDTERARIARDLHDHQAQLLAASRIALEAGPDEARGVLKQLEEALRLRVRELRPATLGRSTLADALRYEMRRLADAGIKVRLLHEQRMNALTRPVQQVCYQVAREALSNVIRHAEATRVEIGVEKLGDLVRLSIIDNGKGAGRAGNGGAEEVSRRGTGMGLTGLGERLEFMGGGFKIESRAGGTRFVAEIPEPG
jgi:signal transduction histidine kinase